MEAGNVKKSIFVLLTALAIGSCVAYRPQAVNLRRDTEQWLAISKEVLPTGCVLKQQRMRLIGLFFNPQLTEARLGWLNKRKAARYAGLWEDPSFELGGERDITERLYNFSLSPTLSLPVTGVPRLAKRVAELYSIRDLQELSAMEQDYLVRLDTLANLIRTAHAKLAIMRQREKMVATELESLKRLQEMGEISPADLYEAEQRSISVVKERQEEETNHQQRHLELISMLGLHPAVGEIEIGGELPATPPEPMPTPSEDELLRHPRICAALVAHKATEEELRMEIRKQYPSLEISPGYAREDGDKKLTLSVGFTLPLWNRNREAIARAAGGRQLAAVSTVRQWHELLQEAHALTARQKLLTEHCRAVYARLLSLQQSAENQEKLYTLGEVALTVLAATRHETYMSKLAYLDCLAQLLEVRTALFFLRIGSPWGQSPVPLNHESGNLPSKT